MGEGLLFKVRKGWSRSSGLGDGGLHGCGIVEDDAFVVAKQSRDQIPLQLDPKNIQHH